MKGKDSLRGGDTDDARRKAAALLGSIKTEAKAASSRENGKKAPPGPGRNPVPLAEIRCTCDAGEALGGHRWNCPRGQAIKRRQAQGRDVLTGAPLESAAA